MNKNNIYKLKVKTSNWQELVVITDDIAKVIKENNIQNGTCYLFVPHTTAGLTINSFLDIDTSNDLNIEINRLIPTRVDFQHTRDTPTDAAGHIKSSMVGINLTLIIQEGSLLLGGSQGVYFWEFDGPREREVILKIIED